MPKRISPLTDAKCRVTRCTLTRPLRLFDGGGLYLEITPAQHKFWRLKFALHGKERRLSLGRYPTVSLVDARKRRDEIRLQLEKGRDPAAERRMKALNAEGARLHTFESVANEWMNAQRAHWADSHLTRVALRLRNELYPALGAVPVGQITARELLTALRKVEARGALDTARRIRQYASGILRFAIATGRAERDVAADLRGALHTPVQHRYATTTRPREVAEILKSIDTYAGAAVVAAALKMAPLLFCRPGELRGMRWQELDIGNALWRIPPARQKLRQREKRLATEDHLVPLSEQAILLLNALRADASRSEFVFPSLRTRTRSISENTVNAALRRLGLGKELITGHGFRHMASTLLNEAEWPGDVIERQLAHRDHNGVRGRYNLAQYLPLRRQMMQRWADYLDELRTLPDAKLADHLPRAK